MKHITELSGVYASGMGCGIKAGKSDLAYVYVPNAVACAGTYTQNHFRAACVDWCEEVIAKGRVKAIIVNSGNANAATGKKGAQNVRKTAKKAAEMLGLKPDEVAVASTGIIGVELPIDKIERGLGQILKNPKKRESHKAAKAIMTTDTHPKEIVIRRLVGGESITVAGLAKGAAMFAPNMATMLAFLVTDVHISSKELQRLLSTSVEASFNMGSVDGDTSTNDMVLILSTGAKKIDLNNKRIRGSFQSLLNEVCIGLTKMIVSDGEGAEKLFEVRVEGAKSDRDAREIVGSIINSPLVKTAIHGADPNWGRVLAAAGKTKRVTVRKEKVDLWFGSNRLVSKGKPVAFSRSKLIKLLKQPEIVVRVNLNLGKGSATGWGCDLTENYVRLNVEYT